MLVFWGDIVKRARARIVIYSGWMLSHVEMIGRIAAGAALGGIIGYERDRHRRPVGLRTHLIVAMAAASFMVISSQFVYWQHYAASDLVEVDASRIAASVVSAVGFLAGGAILRNGASVQGLTTAAGLWLVTAIGMCAGAGMFLESAAVTLLGIIALTALRRFEDKNLLRRQLTIVLSEGAADLSAVVAALNAIGVVAQDVKYDKRLDDEKQRVVATLDLEFADTVAIPKLIEAAETVHGVRRIIVERGA
jgi:putative Mg2+ transporter-C (MgtC) family protein